MQHRNKLSSIEKALQDVKSGKVLIIVDDEDRENEGDFFVAAEKITPETVNFMALYGRGLMCTPLTEALCKEFDLQMMVGKNTDPKQTAFTVSIDLLGHGVTTGISAYDRAKTIKALTEPNTKAESFSRPGHIFPLKAKEGGVLQRAGHTEAAVDLAKLSGLKPVGTIVEILNEDGTMARLPELIKIAEKHKLKIVTIKDLIAYRLQNETLIEEQECFSIHTAYGDFIFHVFRQCNSNQNHYALTFGTWENQDVVPVRVKAIYLNRDLFSIFMEKENSVFKQTAEIIKQIGFGAFVLMNHTQEEGHQKNVSICDDRDYGIGAQIIKKLGISKLNIISHNPLTRRAAMSGYGMDISYHTDLKNVNKR